MEDNQADFDGSFGGDSVWLAVLESRQRLQPEWSSPLRLGSELCAACGQEKTGACVALCQRARVLQCV